MLSVFNAQHNGKLVICIVFHGDSMKRMEQNDPAIVQGVLVSHLLKQDGVETGPLLPLPLTDFLFTYHESAEEFAAKCKEIGSRAKVLQWLLRGYTEQSEDGKDVERIDVFPRKVKPDDGE